MVAMARMDAAPVIDDDVGAEGADHADHVFQDLSPQIFSVSSGVLE